MKRTAVLLLAIIFLFAGSESLWARDKAAPHKPTKAEVVAFVKEAVAYAKENGKQKALKEFMNRKGPFVRGELYIYAYDFNGTVISHGGQPGLVGKNLIGMKDKNGVMVIQGLIKLAKSGGGWLRYLWPNPLHNNAVEPKLGYVEKVDDTWWLGSGMYE
ncbi:MAG: cache domain-containing protein [Smithellaceae bacterium]|nr:cache domain-containing protein [Smithellaceae bacterium]